MKGYPVARIREIFCLWNLESWALNSKNPIQGIHNATYNWNFGIQVPPSKSTESRNWNPEFKTVLDHLTLIFSKDSTLGGFRVLSVLKFKHQKLLK